MWSELEIFGSKKDIFGISQQLQNSKIPFNFSLVDLIDHLLVGNNQDISAELMG